MKSFKERIDLFWRLFLEEEASLRESLENEENFQGARQHIEELIDNTFSTRNCEIGFNKSTNKWELMLTPEGDKARLFALSYWKEEAPSQLLEHWTFYEMRKPMANAENFKLHMYDTVLEVRDVLLYPSLEEGRVNLRVYSEKLNELDEAEAYLMLYIFMQQFIGEAYDMAYIGEVEIVPNLEIEEALLLTELKAYIEDMIEEGYVPVYGDLCEVFTAYELLPSKERRCPLREDIYEGKNALMALVHEYYTNKVGVLDEGQQLGITYGFIFFNTENMSKESALSVRNRLEDQLIKASREKHFVRYIGGATGLFNSYIDCIVYDMIEFTSYMEQLIEKYGFEHLSFKLFRPGGKEITF